MKRVLVLVLMLGLAIGAFAQVSIGALGSYSVDQYKEGYTVSSTAGSYVQNMSSVEALGYIDIGFLTISAGYGAVISGDYSETNWLSAADAAYDNTLGSVAGLFPDYVYGYNSINDNVPTTAITIKKTYIPIELMFKVPIDLKILVISPMFGAGYVYTLTCTDKDGNVIPKGNTLASAQDYWLAKLGVGVDIPLGNTLYIRGQLIGAYAIYSYNDFINNLAWIAAYQGVGATDVTLQRLKVNLSVGIGIKL